MVKNSSESTEKKNEVRETIPYIGKKNLLFKYTIRKSSMGGMY